MSSEYSWIIVKDNIADKEVTPPSNLNAVGMIGPYDSTATPEEIKKGEKFRMSDDDNEIYYYGFIIGDYEGFEPVFDFGMPNAGCVNIEYKNADTGKYEYI